MQYSLRSTKPVFSTATLPKIAIPLENSAADSSTTLSRSFTKTISRRFTLKKLNTPSSTKSSSDSGSETGSQTSSSPPASPNTSSQHLDFFPPTPTKRSSQPAAESGYASGKYSVNLETLQTTPDPSTLLETSLVDDVEALQVRGLQKFAVDEYLALL